MPEQNDSDVNFGLDEPAEKPTSFQDVVLHAGQYVRQHLDPASLGGAVAGMSAGELIGATVGGTIGAMAGPAGAALGAQLGSFAGMSVGYHLGYEVTHHAVHTVVEEEEKHMAARLSTSVNVVDAKKDALIRGGVGAAGGGVIGAMVAGPLGAAAGSFLGESMARKSSAEHGCAEKDPAE